MLLSDLFHPRYLVPASYLHLHLPSFYYQWKLIQGRVYPADPHMGVFMSIYSVWLQQILSGSAHSRVHGHGGELGEDVPAGRCRRVTGEGLGWRHPVPPAELQRTAAEHLLGLRQVRLGRNHHAGNLTVQEVLLRQETETPEVGQEPAGRKVCLLSGGGRFTLKMLAQYSKEYWLLAS